MSEFKMKYFRFLGLEDKHGDHNTTHANNPLKPLDEKVTTVCPRAYPLN